MDSWYECELWTTLYVMKIPYHLANAHRHVFLWRFYHSRLARAKPSLREMSLSLFTERFATGPRFVTSNWRRRHSECTCGTMNSDPPTMTTTTTTTTIMPTRNWGKGAFRGGGRMGSHSRSKQREGVVPSYWYFS